MGLGYEDLNNMLLKTRRKIGLIIDIDEDNQHSSCEKAVVQHLEPPGVASMYEHRPRFAPVKGICEHLICSIHLHHAREFDSAYWKWHQGLAED
mmetsp:Transcript_3770/g.6673  ORF Transcript_3770/g.6673 Transcript_3770/m.6673 type:complete len:94 (-) Transcript_3770:120-401(-)